MPTVYLDNAATTPLLPEVRAAMADFLGDGFGNPSSRHPIGLRAMDALEEARTALARALGARGEQVVFTSGGTEANNLAVLGLARAGKKRGRHVLLGATEHPSVRAPALALREEGFEVEELGLTAQGDVDLEDAARRLREDTCLVCQMLVNNEFGSVYPVAELAALARTRAPRARVHVDAVQAVGKLDLTLEGLGVDSLSLSAHKIHGPKGAGALLLAPGVEPRPLLLGGGQERGLRSGTENVAGIAGCARAVELAVAGRAAAAAHWRSLAAVLCAELARVPGARPLLDPSVASSPAIAALVLPGAPAEVWMHHLEARGVMTSAGSACHARSREVSPALLALGLGAEEARRVLRLSFSRLTTREEVLRGVDALEEVERELRTAVARRR